MLRFLKSKGLMSSSPSWHNWLAQSCADFRQRAAKIQEWNTLVILKVFCSVPLLPACTFLPSSIYSISLSCRGRHKDVLFKSGRGDAHLHSQHLVGRGRWVTSDLVSLVCRAQDIQDCTEILSGKEKKRKEKVLFLGCVPSTLTVNCRPLQEVTDQSWHWHWHHHCEVIRLSSGFCNFAQH